MNLCGSFPQLVLMRVNRAEKLFRLQLHEFIEVLMINWSREREAC